jgi:hypothetical protein
LPGDVDGAAVIEILAVNDPVSKRVEKLFTPKYNRVAPAGIIIVRGGYPLDSGSPNM